MTKYFNFKIVENFSIMDQVQELQVIIFKLKELGMETSEALHVGGIIAKLPLSLNDYRKKLLYST